MPDFELNLTEHNFKGPIELLHELIENKKLHINDVSLAAVADDFISFVKQRESFPVAETAQFILIASTLLLIKSKSLLPTFSLTDEEEERVHDLERQLALHRRMKELSKHIVEMFGSRPFYLAKERNSRGIVFAPHHTITVEALRKAAVSLIEKIPKKDYVPKATVKTVISIQEMISSLYERVNKSLKLSFADFAKGHGSKASGRKHVVSKESKTAVIIGFLALLELVRRGRLSAEQEGERGDIFVESASVEVPRYGNTA